MLNKKRLFFFLLFVLSFSGAMAQLAWPEITATTRPWTRWWWEGSAVNEKDLTQNLETYQQAGLGGVEITPIYGVHGYEKQFVDFLSPRWMELLQHSLKEGKRLGIGVDLANATGWPFGGPWVTDADASKTIYSKTYRLKSGEQLPEKVEYYREALVRTANNKPATIDKILQPINANKNLQDLALDQVQFPGKLPLVCLVAYAKNYAKIDLTDSVDVTGTLHWTAPEGDWTLYALFMGLHGKMVERAAPGGEGYAIDHFSQRAANNYFRKFDESFRGADLSGLRGFFNDSYEVDDARGQADWTEHFLEEFKTRRGYDLRDHLPDLFGDATQKNNRVLYDYRSVIDELILEDFTKQWKKWADGYHKIVRNQSHGSPANTLDLYSVVDIPETEGNDILRFKFATSAANVTGKPLVSSESCTWLNEHFLSSWGDVKKAIDLYFLGGVNHIFYHGTAYSPADAPWPGWLFYAAVHFQPTNPQWKDFHTLNEYIARVQSFLQRGRPDNDVLLYYPIADRYSEPGNTLLQHFDGMERNFEHTDFEQASRWMVEHGYSFDFFSDRQLSNFKVENNRIITGGNSYQCILLPANKLIPASSMATLVNLAGKGALILFYKHLPEDTPGYAGYESESGTFQSLSRELTFTSLSSDIKSMKIGDGGRLAYSSRLMDLFYQFGIRQESMHEMGLRFVRRRDQDGLIYFINNPSTNAFDGWITLQTASETVLVYDPLTLKAGSAEVNHKDNATTEVRLQLAPGASCILKVVDETPKVERYPYYRVDSSVIAIKGNWKIEFLEGGPTIPGSYQSGTLESWTERGEDARNFSGTARYSITFKRPTGRSVDAWQLNLGEVHATAEVFLNGERLGTLIGPSFELSIPAGKLKKKNKMEIVVANLMANRISYMDRKNIPWKIFYNTNMPARLRENVKDGLFDASRWKPLPSGLMGPVTFRRLYNE